LINHPERTLNRAEIDQCIAGALNREAQQVEAVRRGKWVKVLQNATDFVVRR
jgi:hypothetical protein